MSRCIDADALKSKCGDWYVEEGLEEGFIGTIGQLLDEQPTIEPERKTGKWIYPHETTTLVSICSECGAHGRGNFCSNCGADMRGEQGE